jgi:hypothetical protein
MKFCMSKHQWTKKWNGIKWNKAELTDGWEKFYVYSGQVGWIYDRETWMWWHDIMNSLCVIKHGVFLYGGKKLLCLRKFLFNSS